MYILCSFLLAHPFQPLATPFYFFSLSKTLDTSYQWTSVCLSVIGFLSLFVGYFHISSIIPSIRKHPVLFFLGTSEAHSGSPFSTITFFLIPNIFLFSDYGVRCLKREDCLGHFIVLVMPCM